MTRKTIFTVAAAIALAGIASPAFAHGGGPTGAHYWLHKNRVWARSHDAKADYACVRGNVEVVQATPCKAIASR